MNAGDRFAIGVNYWPRSSAMAMWRRFDRGEIAEDFARIAALKFSVVRCFLMWEAFQPEPRTIDATALARLDAVVELAVAYKLQLMPTLFCGHMSGVNWLPDWTLDSATPHGRFRTIAGGRESAHGIGDFYSGALLDAQRFAARTIGARYRAHPAIAAWDLGNEFSNLRAPRTSTDAAAWSRGLTDELREASELPVTGGIHGEDLTQDRAIRPSSICAPWTFATMHGYSIYSGFARDRCDPAVVPFLAALTGACARKRVLFSEFGNPNCPAGTRPMFDRVALPGDAAAPGTAPPPGAAPFACLTDDELAVYADAVLTQLHAGGALGALWWCWADYDRRLAGEPPFDRAPHELHFGLIRSDGREKPVAGVLAAAARARRPIVDPPPPIVDEAAYYAALPGSTGRSYAAYLGRVRA